MKMDTCQVCGSTSLTLFLKRTDIPVHQNLVMFDREEARKIKRGQLEMMVCEDCGFVFNRLFNPQLLSYGEDYDNTQCCSPYFDAYLDVLAKELVELKGVRNCTIVEVGCGKGHFLRKLIEFDGADNLGYGFDPSYDGPDVLLDGRLHFRRSYYDTSCTDVLADVVVCRHVIEHVQHPMELLHSVRAALKDGLGARVFFETPCVEWIFRNKVVWDLFYEHCSLFSPSSLRLAFENVGLGTEQIKHIFGGQYLWFEAFPDQKLSRNETKSKNRTALMAQTYGADEADMLEQWKSRLHRLLNKGKVAIWGAGAKGATFVNLVDSDGTLIDCVVDLNPNKQNRFIPGTGHSIVAPQDLIDRGVASVVLMNPNYYQENFKLLSDMGIEIDLINWSGE